MITTIFICIALIVIILFFLQVMEVKEQEDKPKIPAREHKLPIAHPLREPSKTHLDRIDSPIRPSYLLTNHEKTMFGEIRQAVPECQIFVQVALGAILWTKSQGTRNKFNRLIADFVVTDLYFNILAVIELDDKSHDNKQEKDAKRDAMVREAGYKVLRYRYMPDKQKLRQDILG